MDRLTEDLFKKLISEPKSEHSVEVLEANIFYQKWGSSYNPGMVLVNGSGAPVSYTHLTLPTICSV